MADRSPSHWPPLFIILLAVFELLAGALPTLSAAESKPAITDTGITVAVETDLHLDEGVSPATIQVHTRQGVVTLAGSVNDAMSRERARKIAEAVRGVRAVVNELVVTPVARPDEDIRRDILTALLQDPATEAHQVSVTVHDAAVTLTGSVGSWAEAQLAAQVAREVRGVRTVTNHLVINYASKRTDAEITADVEARLRWDIWVAGDPIKVRVKAGTVTLTGEVGSVLEQTRANGDAWVEGVTSVDDSGLKVNPELAKKDLRKDAYAVKSDAQIKQAVLAAFRHDPRLAGSSPDVLVEDGDVILTGGVSHLRAKSAAGQDAMNTVGVLSVNNLLGMSGTSDWPSDADAQKALRAALAWDPLLAGDHIEAAVLNHTAYLTGTVDSGFDKMEAKNVAARVKGVALIRNHLRLAAEPDYFFFNQPYYDFEAFGPPPPKSDAQIKQDIERAFFWSPFVHRDDITVKVDGGVASLTGTVGSWVGYNEAYQDARKSGASFVNLKNLKVASGAWF